MDERGAGAGIRPGRMDAARISEAFAGLLPPLTAHEARVAADRCLFCHDAPCIAACPTAIDVPLFIRQISTGMERAAGRTILGQNILGGSCARVCPTETLCEEACVRMSEGAPVEIGRLQRFATDAVMAEGVHPFVRAPETGKRVAVVGAGPAGLACAHRLSLLGHAIEVIEARDRPGGLNEYGIAAYKVWGGFAGAEVDWLMGIGGIALRLGTALGRDVTLGELVEDHDAVFLGIGLGEVNRPGIPGLDLAGVTDAVEFIAGLRQAADPSTHPVGREVVVIGGGMTAIDAAVQSRLLGARDVTILYRRGREAMGASRHEQELATSLGVRIVTHALPLEVLGSGRVSGLRYGYCDDGLAPTGEEREIAADQVLLAVGQRLAGDWPDIRGGKIAVDASGRTSMPGVWAGGDCAGDARDLTVTAVAAGRDAALSIHESLMG